MWHLVKSLFNRTVNQVNRFKNSRPTQPAKPHQSPSPVSNGLFPFLVNDPATPSLIENINVPTLPNPCPRFTVNGWTGTSVDPNTAQGHAAQVYATLARTLNFFQAKAASPVTRWTATSNLNVIPHAGTDFNAYYDRQNLKFFENTDPVKRKMVYACRSADVVAHELGHALLDCLRPELWNMQSLEVWAFHEAWGDIIAMLSVMQSDVALNAVIAQVGNDFSKTNCVSELAEELGVAIYDYVSHQNGTPANNPPHGLRNGVNSFNYVNPSRLPSNAPDNQLAAEPHSFGRVFVGVFYDIMVGIYNKKLGSLGTLGALKKARDDAAGLILRAATTAPAVPGFYQSVAKTMITVDAGMGSNYNDVLRQVFSARNINISGGVKALDAKNLSTFDMGKYHVTKTDKNTILHHNDVRTFKLMDHYSIQAQSNDAIFSAEVEVPMQSGMTFDNNGMMIDEIKTTEKEAIKAVKAAVKHIRDQNLHQHGPSVGENHQKPFAVVDGKLVRNFIV